MRFDGLPLVMRVADLPPLAPDTRVRLALGRIDLLAQTLEARFAAVVKD